MHIANLRRKLGDDSHSPRYIRTVRDVGYRMGAGTSPGSFLRRARSVITSRSSPQALHGSGRSAGCADESATGSANLWSGTALHQPLMVGRKRPQDLSPNEWPGPRSNASPYDVAFVQAASIWPRGASTTLCCLVTKYRSVLSTD